MPDEERMYFVYRSYSKGGRFPRRGLVDSDRCWDRPDEHVDEGIGHHLI
jgi:hypothetical protein